LWPRSSSSESTGAPTKPVAPMSAMFMKIPEGKRRL